MFICQIIQTNAQSFLALFALFVLLVLGVSTTCLWTKTIVVASCRRNGVVVVLVVGLYGNRNVADTSKMVTNNDDNDYSDNS